MLKLSKVMFVGLFEVEQRSLATLVLGYAADQRQQTCNEVSNRAANFAALIVNQLRFLNDFGGPLEATGTPAIAPEWFLMPTT